MSVLDPMVVGEGAGGPPGRAREPLQCEMTCGKWIFEITRSPKESQPTDH